MGPFLTQPFFGLYFEYHDIHSIIQLYVNTTSRLPQETIAAIVSAYVSCTNMVIMLKFINQLALHKHKYKSTFF